MNSCPSTASREQLIARNAAAYANWLWSGYLVGERVRNTDPSRRGDYGWTVAEPRIAGGIIMVPVDLYVPGGRVMGLWPLHHLEATAEAPVFLELDARGMRLEFGDGDGETSQ